MSTTTNSAVVPRKIRGRIYWSVGSVAYMTHAAALAAVEQTDTDVPDQSDVAEQALEPGAELSAPEPWPTRAALLQLAELLDRAEFGDDDYELAQRLAARLARNRDLEVPMCTQATEQAVRQSDQQAWCRGADLALELLTEASGSIDEMALDDDCRDGRPQDNVVLRYLLRLREFNDARLDAVFSAVLSDFIAGAGSGGATDIACLRKLSRNVIATTDRPSRL